MAADIRRKTAGLQGHTRAYRISIMAFQADHPPALGCGARTEPDDLRAATRAKGGTKRVNQEQEQ